MKSKKDKERQEFNDTPVTLAVFLGLYNKSIPASFAPASAATLRKFQEAHPTFFEHKDAWSVTRHRKKLIDWLSSNPGI